MTGCAECNANNIGQNYNPQRDYIEEVGNYLTRIASAIVSLFKRILCIEDPNTPQDLFWAAKRCSGLEKEISRLTGRIEVLQKDLTDLRWKNTFSFYDAFFIKATLFILFAPIYLVSLPMIILRSAMYEGAQKKRDANPFYP